MTTKQSLQSQKAKFERFHILKLTVAKMWNISILKYFARLFWRYHASDRMNYFHSKLPSEHYVNFQILQTKTNPYCLLSQIKVKRYRFN